MPYGPAGRVTSRRSQMSSVLQVVPTAMPGVPRVPNPPGPSFQPRASKPGSVQPDGGFSVVYCQVAGWCCDVGNTTLIFGGGGIGAHGPTFA